MLDIKALAREVSSSLPEWLLEKLKAIILFGSVARGENSDGSDLDFLVLVEGLSGTPVERSRVVYKGFRTIRQKSKRDTSIVVATLAEMKTVTPFIINVAFDGIVLYDVDGEALEILNRVKESVRQAGLERYRTSDGGYGWKPGRSLRPGERILVELKE